MHNGVCQNFGPQICFIMFFLVSVRIKLSVEFCNWIFFIAIKQHLIPLLDNLRISSTDAVEIFQNDGWKNMCSYNWKPENSMVICRQLNLSTYVHIYLI